ncbi:MAG TPA: hypothetical protein VEG35_03965 [Burkholderiales bacterium]|nr:hypothetical protein [Burkholderiales bacterium]
MKPIKSAVTLLFLAAAVLAFATPAPAQEKKPQLYFIEEDVVKPAMVAQFEAVVKEVNATLFKAYGWPWPFQVYATDDFHYYFLYPFESLTEIDKGFSIWYGMIGKLGEQKWDALNRKMGDTTEYVKQGTVTLSPQLSYVPEKLPFKPEEAKFIYWGFCYVLPGKEMDFEAQLKKMVALYKAKNVPAGFKSWIGGIGTEMPFYFFSETGRSAADMFLTDEKVTKLVDPEATAIWKDMLKLMRKYEFKTGMPRPDLSYTPPPKAK